MRLRSLNYLILGMIGVAAAGACDSTSPLDSRAAIGTNPASMAIVSGDAQSGLVGAQLPQPVVVKVLDSAGQAVKGQLVNFLVTVGGGSVFAGSALTDAAGTAQEWWTLGSAPGKNTLEARAVDSRTGEKIVFATFNAAAVTELPSGPEKPIELKAVAGQEQASLSWVPGDGYDRQALERKYTSPDGSYTDPNWVRVRSALEATQNSLVDTGLGANATYQYRVIGIAGEAEVASDPASVKILGTAPAPEPTPTPTVASVEVTPATVTLTSVGQTTQLSASARDQSGNPISTSFTWTTSSGAVATVGSTGLVTAVANGTSRVIATAGGRADTSVVTVQIATLPPPPPTGTNEPRPTTSSTVTFRDDFESYDGDCMSMVVAGGGPWTTNPGSHCSTSTTNIITSPQVTGPSGGTSRVARWSWPVSTSEQHYVLEKYGIGMPGGGVPEYYSFWYRAPSFVYATGGDRVGKKLFLIYPTGGSGRITFNESAWSLLESNGNKIDARFDRWPAGTGSAAGFLALLTNGGWHRFTLQRVPESRTGARDGAFRAWFDGELVIERTNLGTYSAGGASIQVAGTFNGGSSKAQQEFFDDLVVWR